MFCNILKILFLSIYFINFNLIIAKQKSITLMLDPAGDAKNIGRIIDKYFERGISLQFAQAIKQELEMLYNNINIVEDNKDKLRIVLSRFPGEMVENLQNASFSNRLNTDLYIRFQFYPIDKEYSDITVYYCSYNKQIDSWKNFNNSLEFMPYNKAYKINFDKTIYFANVIDSFLKDNSKGYSLYYRGLFGLPLKPLAGIVAPSLLIEIGISKKEYVNRIIKPIVEAISSLINSFKNLDKSE